MLFYDLDLGTWVKKPGSTSPPIMTPVLTIGGSFKIPVKFCQGGNVQGSGATATFCGLKLTSDFTGDYLASDNAPTFDGDQNQTFTLDLDQTSAKTYFTDNPTEPNVSCAIQFVFTLLTETFRTVPFPVLLQNDYLQNQ